MKYAELERGEVEYILVKRKVEYAMSIEMCPLKQEKLQRYLGSTKICTGLILLNVKCYKCLHNV